MMNRPVSTFLPSLCLCLGLTSAFGASAPAAQTAYRAADAIVVFKAPKTSDYGHIWFADAARDLTNVLALVTGKSIPLFEEGAEPADARAVIYFGDTEAAAKAGIDTAALRPMEFRLKTVPGRTYLAANSASGSTYAMTEFVERFCDYHFLTIFADDPYTVDPDLRIPTADIKITPAFYWRKIWTQFLHANQPRDKTEFHNREKKLIWRDFFRRSRTYGLEEEYEGAYRFTTNVVYAHTTYCYMPPEKYFKDHPEYYSMRQDGTRQARPVGELCFSHPEVRRIFAEQMIRFMDSDRAANPEDYPQCYPISPQDNNPRFCYCPGCEAIVARYNRVKGGNKEGGDTALYVDFLNDIARRVSKKYDDFTIKASAYVSTEVLPEIPIKVDPHVVMMFADVYSYSDDMIPLSPDNINKVQYEKVKAWAEAGNLAIWDYRMTRPFYPEICIDALVSDIRLFKSLGVDFYFMEHDYMYNDPFWELHHYFYTRLAFDPTLDKEKLLDTFCRSYRANAARMKEVIALLGKAALENPPRNFSAWFNRDLGFRNLAFYEKLVAAVKPCYDAETDKLRKGRIAGILAATYQDLTAIYRTTIGRQADYEKALVLARKYTDESYEVSPYPSPSITHWKKIVTARLDRYDLEFKRLPKGLENTPKKDLLCFDIGAALLHPSMVKRIKDPASEMPLAFRWRGPDEVKPPFKCDADSSEGLVFFDLDIPGENQDGQYHWYKLGIYKVGRNLKFHGPKVIAGEKIHPGMTPSFQLMSEYIDADGLPPEKNPNWYEIWFSCKWSPKSPTNDDDGFYVDRLLFHRIKPPAGRTGNTGVK